jgi:hypothetical protein
MRAGDDSNILIASLHDWFRPMLRADYRSIKEQGYVTIPLGPKRERTFKLFLGSGYDHQPRTPEFETKYDNIPPEP